MFGFEPRLELSTRPEKRIGTEEMWDRAEAALEGALRPARGRVRAQRRRRRLLRAEDRPAHDRLDRPLVAARHGPARLRACPSASSSTYTGADNAEHRPVMIHRALMGSFERFIGILIEHYAGEFPLWLAPVQALVLPVVGPPRRLRRVGRGAARRRRPARAASTTAASRSGARSARRSWRRCRTCSWSATARPSRGPPPLRRHSEGDVGTLAPIDEIAGKPAAAQTAATSRDLYSEPLTSTRVAPHSRDCAAPRLTRRARTIIS